MVAPARIAALFLFAITVSFPSQAQTLPHENATLGESGLPVPRFVSISVGKAYMRAGPGEQYPIEWVYRKEGLPLLVTAEYETWRRVIDAEGTEGWMHVVLLSGERTAVVTGEVRPFYRDPAHGAAVAFRAEPGVAGRILECEEGWCRLLVEGLKGWVPAAHIWGVFEGEEID